MFRFQVQTIDLDHDRIISAFESMLSIVATQEYDRHGRRSFIDLLLHYTSSHFQREEAAMRKAGYPGRGEHLLAHAYLQDGFHRLLRILPEDSPNLASDIAVFRQLFLTHILTHDEAFGDWLKRPLAPRRRKGRSVKVQSAFRGAWRPTRGWLAALRWEAGSRRA